MKISYHKIWTYLVAMICVVPTYANIGSLSVKNVLLVLFYVLTLLLYGISPSRFKFTLRTIPFLTLFVLIWFVQSVVDSTFAVAIMQIFQIVAFWLTVSMSLTNEQQIDSLVESLISITFPLSILGIFEELTSVNIFSELFGGGEIYSEARMGMNRIYSTFTHPISYGIYLTIIALLILYMLDKYENKKLYFNLVLILINLCFTISRSIITAGIASLILMMMISGMLKLTRKKMLLLMAIVILIFISPMLFPNILNFFSEIFRSVAAVFNPNVTAELGSAEGNRKDLYAWTLYTLQGHYIFGMGTTAVFRYVIASYAWGDSVKNSLENQYLYLFFLHGLLGLITYVLSMVNIIVFSIKGLQQKYNKSVMKAVFVIVIMYIIMLFSTAESSENTMWYVVLAMGIATKRMKSTELGEEI